MADARIISRIAGAIHNKDQFPTIIQALEGCSYYAYIYHDHDEGTDLHLHFVAQGRHSLRSWAKLLDIPENMIEIVRNFRGVNRYLIHLDNPEKFLYNPSDVVTNQPIRFKHFLEDNTEVNPKTMFYDLAKIKQGRLSVPDFIDKYQFQIYKMSFYSQFKIYKELMDLGAQFDDFIDL